MKKVFAALLLLLTLAACSADPAEEPSAILPVSGEYLQDAEHPTKETWFPATLILDAEEHTFFFSFDLLSSYANAGSYTTENGVLIAVTNDGQYTFRFKIEAEDRLTFLLSESSPVSYFDTAAVTPLTEGMPFVLTDREHQPEAHGSSGLE